MLAYAPVSVPDAVAQGHVTGWDVLISVIVLVVSWLLARVAARATRKLLGRAEGLSTDVRSITARCVEYLVLVIGVGLALSLLGAQLQPLLLAVLLVALVAVFVLRGIADNFGAGIVLQTRRPIGLADEIEALGEVGVVAEMNSRAVVIRTNDGRTVHLPNRKLLDDPMANCSTLGARRSAIHIIIDTRDREVVGAARHACRSVPGVRAEPDADLLVIEVTDERTIGRLRYWHEPAAGAAVTSAVIVAVADEMAQRGVDAVVTSRKLSHVHH